MGCSSLPIAGARQAGESLDPEVSADFSPERHIPVVDIQMLGTQAGNRHRCIRADELVCGNVFGPQFELALLFFSGACQTVDGQA